MPCYVLKTETKPLAVKNLGWLLRNWKTVELIEVLHPWVVRIRPTGAYSSLSPIPWHDIPDDARNEPFDCWLVARMRDGSTYVSSFADSSLLLNWLDRPVFRGLPLSWFDLPTKVGEWNQ